MTGATGLDVVWVTMSASAPQVAIVTIDFAPLNIGSLRMREALSEALMVLAQRPDVTGAALVGSGSNFVAGSDIREFDAPPQAPHLPEVIALIEQLPFPVVAAIRGAALGGGCELALGCDGRVAAPDAVLGLPEVTLGLIPGAGGTVRLPRLVGAAAALELVTSGKRLTARQALAIGLVDQIAEGDLLEAAQHWLARHPGKRRALELELPATDRVALEQAISGIARKARGGDARGAAAAAVWRSLDLPAMAALELERADSLRLRLSPQSKALRYLFQAERRAGRAPRNAEQIDIARVGVIGAGRMGSDIALVCARAGIAVALVEANPDAVARAMSHIAKGAEFLVRRAELDSVETLVARIRVVPLEELAEYQLVIEAIPEDLAAKQALLAKVGTIAPQAILATNTSYLDIDAIAAGVTGRERVVGLHFFNPANVLKLVEVVRGAQTAAAVIATMLRLARRLGKLPILTAVGEGFVGNRIFAAYRRQCEYLLEDGCLPEQIDQAMQDFGMAMGPFAVFDLAGLDVAWAMRKRLAATRDPAERYVDVPDLLCESGRLGQRAGRGWYDYGDGKPAPSAEVTALIVEASRRKGITRRTFAAGEIVNLLLTAMANEAAWVVQEGVAAQPEDIDVALCNGFGFPRHQGGPLYWAAQQDPDSLAARLAHIAATSGRPTAPNLAAVLAKLSTNGTLA